MKAALRLLALCDEHFPIPPETRLSPDASGPPRHGLHLEAGSLRLSVFSCPDGSWYPFRLDEHDLSIPPEELMESILALLREEFGRRARAGSLPIPEREMAADSGRPRIRHGPGNVPRTPCERAPVKSRIESIPVTVFSSTVDTLYPPKNQGFAHLNGRVVLFSTVYPAWADEAPPRHGQKIELVFDARPGGALIFVRPAKAPPPDEEPPSRPEEPREASPPALAPDKPEKGPESEGAGLDVHVGAIAEVNLDKGTVWVFDRDSLRGRAFPLRVTWNPAWRSSGEVPEVNEPVQLVWNVFPDGRRYFKRLVFREDWPAIREENDRAELGLAVAKVSRAVDELARASGEAHRDLLAAVSDHQKTLELLSVAESALEASRSKYEEEARRHRETCEQLVQARLALKQARKKANALRFEDRSSIAVQGREDHRAREKARRAKKLASKTKKASKPAKT